MDRSAAKDAMRTFLAGKSLSANQIEFVNLIVDHLTEHGVVLPGQLYESPFTDLTPRGPDELFTDAELDELMRVAWRSFGQAPSLRDRGSGSSSLTPCGAVPSSATARSNPKARGGIKQRTYPVLTELLYDQYIVLVC